MKRLVAVFHTPEALVRAAEKMKAEGVTPEDALTPFPLDGLEGALGLQQPLIRKPMAIAGFSAAAFAYGIEWYSAAVAYPLNSGGRPFNSWPVFLLVPFEVGILAAGITGFITFLIRCGLPSPYHPLFEVRGIERATSDRFLLTVDASQSEDAETRLRQLAGKRGRFLNRGGPAVRRAAPLAALFLASCDLSMTQQPKYTAYAPSSFWPNGTSARPLPAGTVAQGDLEREAAEKKPPEVTPALLARGRDRYNAFCTPCHGISGYGNGMVVQRGFPPPPSYHIDRLRQMDGQYFYDVQTNGFGVMYSYADRVSVEDRWAIAAYIRALQLSQYASLAVAPEAAEKAR